MTRTVGRLQRGGSDDEARDDLVTGPDHHRSVVTRMFDHHLYRSCNQVATGQNIFETHVSTPLPIAGSEHIEDGGQASRLPDSSLDSRSNAIEVIGAWKDFVPCVGNGNEWFFQIFIGGAH